MNRCAAHAAFCLAVVASGCTQKDTTADPPVHAGTVDLTIGMGPTESRADYQFPQISGLALHANGQIFVSDAKDATVRVFDSAGVLAYKLGQAGEGPGDLGSPCCINISNSGELWVKETANHRYSVFALDTQAARFVRTVPSKSNAATRDPVHTDADGHVVDLTVASLGAGTPLRYVRIFIDANGVATRADTSPAVPVDSVDRFKFQSNGGVATYNKPFGADRIQAFGEGGLAAYAVNTNYTVFVADAHGAPVAIIQGDLKALNLSAAEEKLARDAVARMARGIAVDVSTLNYTPPKRKPALVGLAFDRDSRLWVERSVEDGKPHEADVYDKTGNWVAIMQWPKNVTMSFGAVKDNTGVGVETMDDGVQRIVRVRFK